MISDIPQPQLLRLEVDGVYTLSGPISLGTVKFWPDRCQVLPVNIEWGFYTTREGRMLRNVGTGIFIPNCSTVS